MLMGKALRRLAVRDYGVEELRTRLLVAHHDQHLVDKVIESLLSQGFLDDGKFANLFIQSRIKRGRGQLLISRELVQKGIERDLISQSIHAIDQEQWIEGAQIALKKKKAKLNNTPTQYRTQVMRQILYQQGFSASTTEAVVDANGFDGVE
jgi:regulatory protein